MNLFLKQYSDEIFGIDLESFFINLYKSFDGNWKFNGNGRIFSEKELIILMDEAFYIYLNSHSLKDPQNYCREKLNLILILANHLFFKNNILEDVSKEYLLQLLLSTSKNNQEILYIRGVEPQKYISEFKKYGMHESLGQDILTENNFPGQNLKFFDITDNFQCKELRFFWFINYKKLTEQQINIINTLKLEGFIGKIYEALNLIINYFYMLTKEKNKKQYKYSISW